jgi:hypothetical protein
MDDPGFFSFFFVKSLAPSRIFFSFDPFCTFQILTSFFMSLYVPYYCPYTTNITQTSMPPAGFVPTIPASERPQTHSLDRADTAVGGLSHGTACRQDLGNADMSSLPQNKFRPINLQSPWTHGQPVPLSLGPPVPPWLQGEKAVRNINYWVCLWNRPGVKPRTTGFVFKKLHRTAGHDFRCKQQNTINNGTSHTTEGHNRTPPVSPSVSIGQI